MRTLSCLSVFVSLILSASSVHAQKRGTKENPQIAFASVKGIYVVCGTTIASSTNPVQDTIGYQIERRVQNGKWSVLSNVEAVPTLQEFTLKIGPDKVARLRKFHQLSTDEELWQYLLKNPTIYRSPIASDRPSLEALGIVWLDANVDSGIVYEYRVSTLLASKKTVIPHESQLVKAGTLWTLAPMRVASVEETDSSIILEWSTPREKYLPSYIHVYRRHGGEETDFQKLTTPASMTLRNDTLGCAIYDRGLLRNNQYEYYVVPEDFWGNVAPESETAVTHTVNFTRLPLPQMFDAEPDSVGVRLTWKTYGKEYVYATRIYRSLYFDSGYVKIAEVPVTDSVYYDYSAEGMTRYYYRMTNVSFGDRESQTSATRFGYYVSPLEPAPPSNLEAVPIKDGVKLRWEPSGEPDIKGYFVCRAVSFSDSLLPISPLVTSEEYVDTSNTLRGTLQYRYAVRALNTSNRSGALSDEVRVRPDIPTLPKPPQNLFAFPKENSIYLNWNDPRDAEPTVIGYVIYRAQASGGTPDFKPLKRLEGMPDQISWFDSTVEKGVRYVYAISCLDAFGGEGIKGKLVEAMIAIERMPPPSDLHATGVQDGIRIEWENYEESTLKATVLYRQEQGKELEKLATINLPTSEYIDKKVKSGIVYYYRIAVLTKDGMEGDRSDDVWAEH